MKSLAKIVSIFFGAGKFPVAPGTFASLIAALGYHFALRTLRPLPYSLLVFGLFVLGVLAAGAYARELNRKDPRPIVIDEVVGQLIALFLAPAGWLWTGVGFLLFRIFDVLKPFPIRRMERFPWGWGIMADDVLAGVFSALILQATLWLR